MLWCWEKILSQNIFDRSINNRLNNNNYQKIILFLLTVLKETQFSKTTLFTPKLTHFNFFYFSFKIMIFQFNIKQRPFKFKLNCKIFFHNTLLNRNTLGFSKFALKKEGIFGVKNLGMLLQSALKLVPNVGFYSKFPVLLPI